MKLETILNGVITGMTLFYLSTGVVGCKDAQLPAHKNTKVEVQQPKDHKDIQLKYKKTLEIITSGLDLLDMEDEFWREDTSSFEEKRNSARFIVKEFSKGKSEYMKYVDDTGNLLYAIKNGGKSKEYSLIKGWGISGISNDMKYLPRAFKTIDGKYIARVSTRSSPDPIYFLIDEKGKLLTPGGLSLSRKMDPSTGEYDIFTGPYVNLKGRKYKQMFGKVKDMKGIESFIEEALRARMGVLFDAALSDGIRLADHVPQPKEGSKTLSVEEQVQYTTFVRFVWFEYRKDGLYAPMK